MDSCFWWGGGKQEKNFTKRWTCTFSDKTGVNTELQGKFTENKKGKPILVKAILSPPKKCFNSETPHNRLRNDRANSKHYGRRRTAPGGRRRSQQAR